MTSKTTSVNNPSESYIMPETSEVTPQLIAFTGKPVAADPYKTERIHQAHVSFHLALGLTAGGAIVILANVLLFVSGNVSAAVATSASGLASGSIVCGRKLYKDANDRLDRAVKALEDDEADDEA